MREYGFTDCERGAVDACESGVISNIVDVSILIVVVIVLACIVRKLFFSKKNTYKPYSLMIKLQRRKLYFYGLCGSTQEEKTVTPDEWGDIRLGRCHASDSGWVFIAYTKVYKDA